MTGKTHWHNSLFLYVIVSFLLSPIVADAAEVTTMTYEQAVRRMPDRKIPKFWAGDVTGLSGCFEKLTEGEVRTIAISPGSRPMHLVTFGKRENPGHKANFNSAVGGAEPAAYMDKPARKKPVVLFIGPVHGAEVEGLTGLVNFINIMERGEDLRGVKQAKLRALGEQCRLLIVPEGNPDGIARFEPRGLCGMEGIDLRFWGQGTWSDDTFCGWPESKRRHPMAGDDVGFLGCYFNDKGINPMHDEFFAPMGPEAPAILKLAAEEGPDLVVSLHSHESKPAVLRPAYVTVEIQQDIRLLAERCYGILAERDLPHADLFAVESEGGKNPSPFNLTSALYHISGANSFTFECPHGLKDGCHVSFEQILDIQLSLYEAMLQHELDKKNLRRSNKTKVLHICHSEHCEESRTWGLIEILRSAQGDTREVLLECLNYLTTTNLIKVLAVGISFVLLCVMLGFGTELTLDERPAEPGHGRD